jgi:hypothetical protein
MGKYKHYILFIILVTIGFSAFYSVSAGNYPIALAGGELVFARDFWKNYNGASTYSQKMASIVSSSSRQISESELQVVVLDQLIEDKLVKKELKSQTKSDFGNLVDQKIARYSGDKDLEQAASM